MACEERSEDHLSDGMTVGSGTSSKCKDVILAAAEGLAKKKAPLARVSSMPTPCRARPMSSSHLQTVAGSLTLGSLRRRDSSFDQAWPQFKTWKEASTPSTRTPSPAPSLRSLPLAQTTGFTKPRRSSRTISRSASEAFATTDEIVQGLDETFRKLCSANREGAGIECRLFKRICKDAGFVDSKFTAADADLVFSGVTSRSLRRLDLPHFESAIRLLAERICLPAQVVIDKVKAVATSICSEALGKDRDASCMFATTPGSRRNSCPVVFSPSPPSVSRMPSLTLLETPPRHRPLSGQCAASGDTRSSSSSIKRTAQSVSSCGTRLASSTSSSARGGPCGSEQAQRELLLDTFAGFCWGRPDMDGRGFARLCRDCRLLDSRFTALDADLLFTKVLPKGQRRLDIENFEATVIIIAERRKVPESAVRRAIMFCHGPLVRATQAGEVRLHDDRGGYTGTHVLGGPESGALGQGTVASIW